MPKIEIKTWKDYKARWGKGCGSVDCKRASHVVLARGKIPCDVLFIGEAPGVSEDTLGVPFVGQAGKLLDQIIARAIEDIEPAPRIALTNLVGCIPLDEESRKTMEPDADTIAQCSQRLQDFVNLSSPRMIVLVGRLAEDWLDPRYKTEVKFPDVPVIKIIHPAAILRMNVATQGLSVQRCIVDLNSAMMDL